MRWHRSESVAAVQHGRLRLRPAGQLDLVRIHLCSADPDAQRWLGWASDQLLPDKMRPRAEKLSRGTAPGAVLPRHDDGRTDWVGWVGDTFVGYVTLGPVVGTPYEDAAGSHALAIGGSVVRSLRGHGVGTRLFATATRAAHDQMGAPRVVAGCESTNEACLRSLLKAGFHLVPGAPTHHLPDGRDVPAQWLIHDRGKSGDQDADSALVHDQRPGHHDA